MRVKSRGRFTVTETSDTPLAASPAKGPPAAATATASAVREACGGPGRPPGLPFHAAQERRQPAAMLLGAADAGSLAASPTAAAAAVAVVGYSSPELWHQPQQPGQERQQLPPVCAFGLGHPEKEEEEEQQQQQPHQRASLRPQHHVHWQGAQHSPEQEPAQQPLPQQQHAAAADGPSLAAQAELHVDMARMLCERMERNAMAAAAAAEAHGRHFGHLDALEEDGQEDGEGEGGSADAMIVDVDVVMDEGRDGSSSEGSATDDDDGHDGGVEGVNDDDRPGGELQQPGTPVRERLRHMVDSSSSDSDMEQ